MSASGGKREFDRHERKQEGQPSRVGNSRGTGTNLAGAVIGGLQNIPFVYTPNHGTNFVLPSTSSSSAPNPSISPPIASSSGPEGNAALNIITPATGSVNTNGTPATDETKVSIITSLRVDISTVIEKSVKEFEMWDASLQKQEKSLAEKEKKHQQKEQALSDKEHTVTEREKKLQDREAKKSEEDRQSAKRSADLTRAKSELHSKVEELEKKVSLLQTSLTAVETERDALREQLASQTQSLVENDGQGDLTVQEDNTQRFVPQWHEPHASQMAQYPRFYQGFDRSSEQEDQSAEGDDSQQQHPYYHPQQLPYPPQPFHPYKYPAPGYPQQFQPANFFPRYSALPPPGFVLGHSLPHNHSPSPPGLYPPPHQHLMANPQSQNHPEARAQDGPNGYQHEHQGPTDHSDRQG